MWGWEGLGGPGKGKEMSGGPLRDQDTCTSCTQSGLHTLKSSHSVGIGHSDLKGWALCWWHGLCASWPLVQGGFQFSKSTSPR